jgi:hypothetical protein
VDGGVGDRTDAAGRDQPILAAFDQGAQGRDEAVEDEADAGAVDGPFMAHDPGYLGVGGGELDLADHAPAQGLQIVEVGDLSAVKFVDDLHGPKKLAAKLAGFDGAYLRFAGEVRVEHYQGEQLVENHTDDALWELMYFGKARP